MKNPTQCILWSKPEILDDPRGTPRFETIETYNDDSHWWRSLVRCLECGQRYFHEFLEFVDWDEGNDERFTKYIPVETNEEIEALKNTSEFGLLEYSPRLQKSSTHEVKTMFEWIGGDDADHGKSHEKPQDNGRVELFPDMETTYSKSAGGVVLNRRGEVLVVNQRGDSWSLPKGHIDEGENAETAARREINEESGVSDLTLIKKLGEYQRHRIGKGGAGEDRSETKVITVFLFTTKDNELKPLDPHNPEARWVPKNEVAALLTHPKDRVFFAECMEDIANF